MSPSIIPDRVTPPARFAPEEAQPKFETILPRTTFVPANRAESVNAQVEAHAAMMQARDNTQIAQGFLNEMTRSMHAEFTKLHNEIAALKLQLDRLESAQ